MFFGINLFTFVSLDDELQLHQSLSMYGHNIRSILCGLMSNQCSKFVAVLTKERNSSWHPVSGGCLLHGLSSPSFHHSYMMHLLEGPVFIKNSNWESPWPVPLFVVVLSEPNSVDERSAQKDACLEYRYNCVGGPHLLFIWFAIYSLPVC